MLQLKGITHHFGDLVANDAISLELQPGQVLALLGENGAGKSTLVSILFGHYTADAGEILIDGQRLPPGDPAAALARGIGMVHQHFALADNLTVLENIIAGTRSLWSPTLRRNEARARITETCTRFGLAIDPWARVAELSVGERQRVEILKALYRGAKYLILDEPTAVLTPQESESLFATLAQLVAQGLAIIFISHKLDEVLRVSDRIAVLRGGRVVANLAREEAGRDTLAEIMVGHRVAAVGRQSQTSELRTAQTDDAQRADDVRAHGFESNVAPDEHPVLSLRQATVRAPDGRLRLDAVSLDARAGQIFGIAGVSGNGQATLADVLCGMLTPDTGSLSLADRQGAGQRVAGENLPADPSAFTARGVARIPEDRHALGVIGELAVWENAILDRISEPAFSRWGWIRRGAARRHAKRLATAYDVRGLETRGTDTATRVLSGGNMQKLILGRALSPPDGKTPTVIIANQPTWGLDVGAVAFVHGQLLKAAQAGAAIILISEDLDELFAIATSIAVMHAGRLGQARRHDAWTIAAIGAAMGGTVPA